MSLILFIDTAASHTQVALANENSVLANVVHEQPNEQAKVLNTLIENQLKENDLTWNDIDAIAVDGGPGSYTGLRVGLGVAKGLCFALDKPIFLFNRLQLLAGRNTNTLIVLKARVGEGFAYAQQNGTTVYEAAHIFYDQFDLSLFDQLELLTDDASLLEQLDKAKSIPTNVIDVEVWNHFSQERFSKKDFDDLAYCEPFYLKSAFTTASKKKII